MKRWTRDARDVLQSHLQIYQRDHADSRTMTHRHTALYVHAMELVRLGDASIEAYERGMKIIRDGISALAKYEDQRDGLGLEDRAPLPNDEADQCEGANPKLGMDALELNVDTLAGLDAPEKRRKLGRPKNNHEKALYEELSKRTRYCSICRGKGHKKTTCPERGDLPKKPRKEAKCSNCGVAGHRRNTCTNAQAVKLQTSP
ncbi:hypothetical protein VPH35_022491 [Triticum aestivum]